MNENTVAVFAPDKEIALRLTEGVRKRIRTECAFRTFTEMKALKKFLKENPSSYLLIDRGEDEVPEEAATDRTIILGDEDMDADGEPLTICRYDGCTRVAKTLLTLMAEGSTDTVVSGGGRKLHILGAYSPVKRNLQTTFCVALGEYLARGSRVLYMNFEGFSGFSGIMEKASKESPDITDFLYYCDTAPEKLQYKLPNLVRTIGKLDVIMPPLSYLDTYDRSAEKWLEVFSGIASCGIYDYLILDLSESVQGLIQILSACERVFTITGNDRMAAAKLFEYEKWMKLHECAGIMDKTIRCTLPVFGKIPEDFSLLTHGELSNYIGSFVKQAAG
ncbi:MAG: hypothetical protein K6E33_03215 [Lachnospiraceae bacterium]|nr:hypothetical protein [Lachnospiraceae bacterium]